MVEVFKTNIETHTTAQKIAEELAEIFPGVRINFDLEDCDKVLRAEGNILPEKIIEHLKSRAFNCEILE
jgi:hypothetical protein